MPNALELASYVTRTGKLTIPMGKGKVKDVIEIPVTVTDARQIFGRLELRVCPLHGSGAAWAKLNTSLKLDKKAGAK